MAARRRQVKRFKGTKIFSNAQMGNKGVKQYCPVGPKSQELLEMAVNKLGFSARAYNRILKVARTIADLEEEKDILAGNVSEAIQYRMMDKYF